ncbi:hypothetical protein SPB21_03010 [Leptothoe sp. ISB3NOV94-8A]|uniref:Uncharacterized protein n=1 Tax=Adonisia turfae CCMR0081 TaxID=2292702 RepID=A0A6M0RQS6_9CYAN|nr:hypothetical protein [Adonisia turfae]NEZ58133.1 hypothetical protein [Adonisia turfae CCMR0081]
MEIRRTTLRNRIVSALSNALSTLPFVLAGWEGGSAAFDLVDEYSDIDLNFLLDGANAEEPFYAAVQLALEEVSPVVACHSEPPGRYFKLAASGDFLLVDVCVFQKGDYVEYLDPERHGKLQPLFDKGEWLRFKPSERDSQETRRAKRSQDLEEWFSVSQSFVQKAIDRGQEAEALAAFWGYTLKPLVELLRMRYCSTRWDFGMRYLQRDLPGPVYNQLRDIMFVGEPSDLKEHHAKAVVWGQLLLQELELSRAGDPPPKAG